MKISKIQQRLTRIFNISPPLKRILFSNDPLEIKKERFRQFISGQLLATFDNDPSIPPLEWVLTRDAIQAFRTILSNRSEELAGYSFLKYLDDLINHPHQKDHHYVDRQERPFGQQRLEQQNHDQSDKQHTALE